MTVSHEAKETAAASNIQDSFLNLIRRERLTVSIRLMDGTDVDGQIKNFDRFAVIIERDGADHLIFKHAIASISSPRAIANYYASHA